MAVFYKGVGFGRFYASNDARKGGIAPRADRVANRDAMISHIVDGTEGSPYVSLTKSYSVALGYARIGKRLASEDSPGVVYEISIEEGEMGNIVDPVAAIAGSFPPPANTRSISTMGRRAF